MSVAYRTLSLIEVFLFRKLKRRNETTNKM